MTGLIEWIHERRSWLGFGFLVLYRAILDCGCDGVFGGKCTVWIFWSCFSGALDEQRLGTGRRCSSLDLDLRLCIIHYTSYLDTTVSRENISLIYVLARAFSRTSFWKSSRYSAGTSTTMILFPVVEGEAAQ